MAVESEKERTEQAPRSKTYHPTGRSAQEHSPAQPRAEVEWVTMEGTETVAAERVASPRKRRHRASGD